MKSCRVILIIKFTNFSCCIPCGISCAAIKPRFRITKWNYNAVTPAARPLAALIRRFWRGPARHPWDRNAFLSTVGPRISKGFKRNWERHVSNAQKTLICLCPPPVLWLMFFFLAFVCYAQNHKSYEKSAKTSYIYIRGNKSEQDKLQRRFFVDSQLVADPDKTNSNLTLGAV